MLSQLKKNFDEYSLKARVFPSLLAFFPFFLLCYIFLLDFTGFNFLKSIFASSIFTVVALFLVADGVRNLGKYMEQKVFCDELEFPTTHLLLHSNNVFSQEKRQQIRDKMTGDFSCVLSTLEEETQDLTLAKKRLKEAVGLVRQKVENGRLLLHYNIRYGFWRNLIGTTPIAMIFCILGCVVTFVGSNIVLYTLFSGLFFFYGAIYVFRQSLLKFFAEQYAEQLFLEYLK